TTITVPPDLKARMDEVEEDVNWSAIACEAFEQKLAEIIQRRGTVDMTEVIDRLRASKRKHASEQYQQGLEAGQHWARDEAEAEELIQLEKLRDRCWRDWEGFFVSGGHSAYGVAERFVFAIWPEENADRDAPQNYWEQRGFEDYPDDEFIRGFAEG